MNGRKDYGCDHGNRQAQDRGAACSPRAEI